LNDASEVGSAFLRDIRGRRHPRLYRHIGRLGRYRAFLFYVFVVIFLVLLILGLTIFRV